ncbi:MAG: IS21 family transposase [Flavisolibacter sp.]
MTYHLVNQFHRDGFSISYISKHFGLDWRTVKKYLSMTEPEYEAFLHIQSQRRKELEAYEGFVKSRLSKFPETSAAQMHDWLKEHYPDFPQVSQKTVFNFVAGVRQKYHLVKPDGERDHAMVEETPYGVQAQADFGEYNLRNNQGDKVKVYFIAMVLSRSRYKYVFFSTSKFTTDYAIEGHERGFAYFEGIPDTMVYDQDRVFLVDENKGDLVLTEKFRAYSREAGFKLHFCRKADPQSKGKVENVVKYVKQSFLYNRPFSDIETLNQQALDWLARTANYLPHAVTKKPPCEEWQIEKAYLQACRTLKTNNEERLTYTVRKDNSISYKGNFYSLPLGTYKGKGSKVELIAQQGTLLIYESPGSALLCSHRQSPSKGQKILNTDHKREKAPGIAVLIDQICQGIQDPGQGKAFLQAIRSEKPRYIRDQALMVKQSIEKYPPDILSQALAYCCSNKLNSASDLKSIAEHLQGTKPSDSTARVVQMNPFTGSVPKEAFVQPATSSIADYCDLF